MSDNAPLLKLAAIDEDDLAVISAHVQDAVLKVGDMVYLPKQNRFALAMNRFSWENAADRANAFERHRAALVFDRVRSVRVAGIDRAKPDAVLELLAVRFLPGDAPDGTIEMCFAGGAGIRIDVECIETRLADLGAAWATGKRPWHAVDGQDDT